VEPGEKGESDLDRAGYNKYHVASIIDKFDILWLEQLQRRYASKREAKKSVAHVSIPRATRRYEHLVSRKGARRDQESGRANERLGSGCQKRKRRINDRVSPEHDDD
jgi:hypothetical protein